MTGAPTEDQDEVMSVPTMPEARVFENPTSGERIVIPATPPGPGATLLTWQLFLAPGGRVPGTHAHPRQEERFIVLDGRMRFRVGWRRRTAGAGETVTVRPGQVHSFANAGADTAHVVVETRPALAMAALLETAAAMARDAQATGRRFPRLVDLALFLREFEPELKVPYLPAALVRLVTRPLTRLAVARGLDARYRRLRPAGLAR
jgi:quercetin dioxygenase-like cupin family protein